MNSSAKDIARGTDSDAALVAAPESDFVADSVPAVTSVAEDSAAASAASSAAATATANDSQSVGHISTQSAPRNASRESLNGAIAREIIAHSYEELCVLAVDTGRITYLNPALLRNLQFTANELVGKLFTEIACDLDMAPILSLPKTLPQSVQVATPPSGTPATPPSGLVQNLPTTRTARLAEKLPATQTNNQPQQSAQPTITTRIRRKNDSGYPAELAFYAPPVTAVDPLIIVSIRDLSERQHSAATLALIEARFRAIVSNTPGLVYQFRRMPDGSVGFPYLSEACHALLGIDPEKLTNEPDLFVTQILVDDRANYIDSMEASAADATTWNWEGRIHIAGWNDIKWINLRATPRLLPCGGMQWEGIMTNITQSKREQTEIIRSRTQLAELSAHVERVKEDERTRIAREIHDDLGGNLTAIKMALALLKRRLPEDPTLTDKADYVDSLVDRTIESIHRISIDLRPSVLDFGIVAAIDWQAREFEKQAGIPCQLLANKKEVDLSAEQASALFRIFQESLTNISKHARATRVTVKLTRTTSAIRLEIRDNGRGIDALDQLKPKSFGIRGMIERASALGGKLTVTNADEGGSVVTIRLPLPSATNIKK